FHRLFDQFNVVLGTFDTAQSATAAFARLIGVAEMATPDLRDGGQTDSRSDPGTDGSVSLRDVRFSYGADQHTVIDGVDLDVQDGEHVAVV
ncbi:ABC transporter ATP-binding protein, partial [Streptomyces sp. SID10244]|nr:ABC transporter ATP-binding protein [Streptomyces sp. SID10244]